MTFTRKNLQHTPARRSVIFKYLTMFFLGASCVLLITQAFEIDTVDNAIQYINQIFLTADGSNQTATGIILNGTNGNGFFNGSVGVGIVDPTDNRLQVIGNITSSGFIERGDLVTASTGSTAMGYDTHANGKRSTAMGENNYANGDYSTAMGRRTTASGNYSTAMGEGTHAYGIESTAMGVGTTAWDHSTAMGFITTALYMDTAMGAYTNADGYSTAMGYRTTAGDYSTAMGDHTTATGHSTAMGANSAAIGKRSTAMGGNNHANGDSSTAMGGSNHANGEYSTAMGGGNNANGYFSTAMGMSTTATGTASFVGGSYNNVTGSYSAIVGGDSNNISGVNNFIGGGNENNITGGSMYSTIPGGQFNSIGGANYSFVGGYKAHAFHDNTFVWNSDTSVDFSSVSPGTFIINAPYVKNPSSGGVGINTDNPQTDLDVSGSMIVTQDIMASSIVLSGSIGINESIHLGQYTGTSCIPYTAGEIIFSGSNFYGCNGSVRKQLDN